MVDDEGVIVEDERAAVVVGNVTVGVGEGGVAAGGGAIRQQLELSPVPIFKSRAKSAKSSGADCPVSNLTGSPHKDALAEKQRK